MQVLAAAASHHRLAWIHPFLDGNGRVARLHTHALLRHMGLTTGLWSPLRGFARSQERYDATLAAADEPRAGDLDGRGTLTERGLLAWISYVLEVSLDQVRFMSGLLQLSGMQDRIPCSFTFLRCGRKHRFSTRIKPINLLPAGVFIDYTAINLAVIEFTLQTKPTRTILQTQRQIKARVPVLLFF